jgi:superfamily II DNA/RNA helicase
MKNKQVEAGLASLGYRDFNRASGAFEEALPSLKRDEKAEGYYYYAIARLGAFLEREVAKKEFKNQDKVAKELDQIEQSFLQSLQFNPHSHGIANVLGTLIPALRGKIQAVEPQTQKVRAHFFLEELIKFKLLYVTKLHLSKGMSLYVETHETSIFSGLMRPSFIKRLKAFLQSVGDDALYMPKEKLNELYALFVPYSHEYTEQTKALFTELDKQLFLDDLRISHYYSLEMFYGTSFLNLDSVTTLLASTNYDSRKKVGSFLGELNRKKLLTEDVFKSLISILNSSASSLDNIEFIAKIIKDSGLDPDNRLLKNFFSFALAKIPHAINDYLFDDFISSLQKANKDPKDTEINVPRILMNLNLFSLFNNGTLDIHLFHDAFKLIKETEEALGDEVFAEFIARILKNKSYHAHLIPMLSWGLQLRKESLQHLYELMDKNEDWEQLCYTMNDVLLKAHQQQFPEKPLDLVIEEFRTKEGDVQFTLEDDEISLLKKRYLRIKELGESLILEGTSTLQFSLQSCVAKLKANPKDEESQLKLLAIIRQQIKEEFGIFPYNVQMINLLALLNEPRRIAQIKTGEGKSTLIAMLAAFNGLSSHKVDVVTTSRDLAIRDAKKFESFYKRLGLKVGHNAKDQSTSADYLPHVIYGTNFDFEFAYLRGETQGEKEGRGKRPYDVVIADEVDSMFIDMQRNEAILSFSADGVYPSTMYEEIWQWVNEVPAAKQTPEQLQVKLKASSIDISLEQAKTWIESANNARRYKQDKHYVILPKKNQKNKRDEDDEFEVQIVDFKNTGQISTNSRWQDGLHCFIEAKHRLKVRAESLTKASVNHIEFFNKYKTLIGVTGTLGSQSCRDELRNLYNVNSYDSPAYRRSLKKPVAPVIAEDSDAQELAVLNTIKAMVRAGRPSLILCETIEESEKLFKLFKKHSLLAQLYNGVQTADSDTIIGLAGNSGSITIATNTAGRGTDIVVTPKAEASGGLHVVMTFPANNVRVEQQAFGRTGRQGRQGTYQYILRKNQFNPGELEQDSAEAIIAAMAVNREKRSKLISSQNILNHEFMHVQFIMQSIFFALPQALKTRVMEPWAKLKTEMQKYSRKFTNDELLEDETDAIKSMCDQFNAFWNKHIRNSEALYLSPLHFAIQKKDAEAVELFMEHLPELMSETNDEDQSAEDLIKQLVQTDELKFKVGGSGFIRSLLFFAEDPDMVVDTLNPRDAGLEFEV